MHSFINKLKNKKHSDKRQKHADFVDPLPTSSAPVLMAEPSTPSAVVTSFRESHEDIGNSHVDHYEKTEVIPSASASSLSAPPLPMSDSEYSAPLPIPTATPMEVFPTESSRTVEVLPSEVIEMPMILHETIRQEQVEEIQTIMTVEREKTEIRQITQPLMDKEVRPIVIEERTLPVEVLPTIVGQSTTAPRLVDSSTRDFDATLRQVIEKTPIVQETEKWRIIEEVQPIIYREVIVPHIIRTNKAMREVIVEAPVMTEQTLQTRSLTWEERQRWSAFFTQETVAREIIPASSIPIMSIANPVAIRVAPMANAAYGKDILTETTTVTETTTAALGAGSMATTGGFGKPVVLGETHDVKFGPQGEKITRDSITTASSSSVLPTRAM